MSSAQTDALLARIASMVGMNRADRMASMAPFVDMFRAFSPVLDAGSGDGAFLELLRGAGVAGHAIDRDASRIASAAPHAILADVRDLRELDVLLKSPTRYGGIMARHIIEELDSDDFVTFVLHAFALLRPGGRLLIITPSVRTAEAAERFWNDPHRVRPYPRILIGATLKAAGFEIIAEGAVGPNEDVFIAGQRPLTAVDPPANPPRLEEFGAKRYSQNGEDGILAELFRRLGVERGTFVEFGIQDGTECNGRLLAERGWTGVFIEGDPGMAASAAALFAPFPGISVAERFITRDNIAGIFEQYNVPHDLDLLSIDIDGNDYYVWQALSAYRPRVLVIEFNPLYPPPSRWVMPYNAEHTWGSDDYYGASLAAYEELGKQLGYVLVGTDRRPVNAFFVREDLLEQSGFPRVTATDVWRLPDYCHPAHG